jgi:hypothetical protein
MKLTPEVNFINILLVAFAHIDHESAKKTDNFVFFMLLESSLVKAAHRTLMKLPLTVNFIKVKRANFSYELCFSSYILALAKNSYEKFVRKTLMKLTPGYHRTCQRLGK